MELREAIRIAENEILSDDVFSGYCKYCERDATTQCIENGCKYEIAVDTLVKTLLKPTPKTIIAPGRREKKNTYEFGLIVGTKRERNYWESLIKEKIAERSKYGRDDVVVELEKLLEAGQPKESVLNE